MRSSYGVTEFAPAEKPKASADTGDNTVVQVKGKKGPKKPGGDSDPGIKGAAHSGGDGPKTEQLNPDSVPQYEAYGDPRVRMHDEQRIGMIHDYYSSDGTRDDLAMIAKRSDSWGDAAKKFQVDLAAFDKARKEYFEAEKKFKSQTEADADPALYQKFRDLSKMAETLEKSPYHQLEATHTGMMKDLGREVWPLENALAKMHFAELGANFEQGKTGTSFDFQMTFTSLDSLALHDGRWKGRRTEDLVKAEVRVESWDKAEEILSGLRQSKVKVARDGKETTEYALELTGDIAKSPDGKKGRVAVTVKGPPQHNLQIHFELSAAQAQPEAAQQPLAAAAGAGDRIVLRTVSSEPSFEGRSGHDLSGFRGGLAADYHEAIQSSDSRHLSGGLLVPQAPGDPAPTVGGLWKVKAVQGDYVQLEDGRSFRDGKASPVSGPILLKMKGASQYQAGDEVRFIPPVAGGSGDNKSRVMELRPPDGAQSLIIGRDHNTSQVVLGGASVSRNHATIERNQEGQWFLLDGTRDANGARKLSQNGVKAWDGQKEVPVGRENWFPLVDGQHIKIGDQWMVFRAPTAAKPAPVSIQPQ
ncbi:MAG TPA: FHA domain-containing protein, partial [bacterium]|nr:FHA domain-containing protein [bacterium]